MALVKTKTLKTSFVSGEMSPQVSSRVDLQQYYNAAAQLQNVIVMPQGGISKRPGTKLIKTFSNHSSDLQAYRLETFVFNNSEKYLVIFTHQNIKILDCTTDQVIADVTTNLTEDDIKQLGIVQSQDTMIITHYAHHPMQLLRDRSNGSTKWTVKNLPLVNIPKFDFGDKPTVKTTETDPPDNSEPVWSDKRGYPATAMFHQGRLWFGGSQSRPQSLWGSRSAMWFDFGVTSAENIMANDAIDLTLTDTRSNVITGLFASKSLLIFTEGGVFTLNGKDGLVTPMNAVVSKESDTGAKFISPTFLDNDIFYLQVTGSVLNNITYDFASNSYQTAPNSLFSSHLLKKPKSLTTIDAGDKFDTGYMYVVNNDGTLAVFSRMASQNISNWTSFTTNGKVIAAAGVLEDLYLVVLRKGAGHNYYNIEKLSTKNEFIDCSVNAQLQGQTAVGLQQFANREISALLDGYPVKITVDAAGVSQLPFLAKTVACGESIDCKIKTMPLNVNLPSGSILFDTKRITKVTLDCYESLGFDVEYCKKKYKVASSAVGFKLRQPPLPWSSVKTVRMLGFDKSAQFTISSLEPTPLTILSVETECCVQQ